MEGCRIINEILTATLEKIEWPEDTEPNFTRKRTTRAIRVAYNTKTKRYMYHDNSIVAAGEPIRLETADAFFHFCYHLDRKEHIKIQHSIRRRNHNQYSKWHIRNLKTSGRIHQRLEGTARHNNQEQEQGKGKRNDGKKVGWILHSTTQIAQRSRHKFSDLVQIQCNRDINKPKTTTGWPHSSRDKIPCVSPVFFPKKINR